MARTRSENFSIAEDSERRVHATLAALSPLGYHLLADRAWPGSSRANVDLIVVGPSGLHIVDTKAWAEPRVDGDRMFREDEDVTDDIVRLADLAFSTEDAMQTIGLAPGEVHATVVLAGSGGFVKQTVASVDIVSQRDAAKHITARHGRLTRLQVDTVLARALEYFPLLGSPAGVDTTISEPVLDASDSALETTEEIHEALLSGILAQPIEAWMSFLHPDQVAVVRKSFSGPSRIRGAAGTGKTVVGLHRAAYIARSRPGKVLFVTFINTLPAVLEKLFARMAPEVADRVEFTSVHRVAASVLRERGIRCDIDEKAATSVFDAAWKKVGAPGALGKIDSNSRYWRDELTKVIKGRGITEFDQYADLARTGRRRRLAVDARKAIWELYTAYEDGLRENGIHDVSDQILLAEKSLAAEAPGGYSAVIIDEAQDLSAAALRMLAHLPEAPTDGLTLIGDGQQAIYPGGYALSEVDISLAGRGTVMTTNYRNTEQIVQFAASLVVGDEFGDIEGTAGIPDEMAEIIRTGELPQIRMFPPTGSEHDDSLVARIKEVVADDDVRFGDVAVLTLDTSHQKKVTAALIAAKIECVSLEKYDGSTVERVKIGTVKRAKGLEFKHVLAARVPRALLEPETEKSASDDAVVERRQLERRELYVAITRARDSAWVGAIS